MEKVSVVITVLNESETIEKLLVSLRAQTLKPQEVIIVDGGSTDGTWDLLQKTSWIKSYQKQGNRSVGRNFGVNKSQAKLIAFTDSGCIPEKNWLKELILPFESRHVEVVSGYYKGDAKNVFEKSLVPYVLVMPDRIPKEFLPATRSMALRRSVWDESGEFNEKLDHNEDYEFANRLKALGYKFHFSAKAIVSWQPRKNLKNAAWMFLRFALGDAQSGIIRSKVKLLALRYYIFFFLVFITQWTLILILPYLIWAIYKNYRYVRNIRSLFWLPVLQVVSDIMILFGTIVGLLSRI